jgi:Tol biopolymer transport system component
MSRTRVLLISAALGTASWSPVVAHQPTGQQPPATPARAAVQAPPDTEIYLAPLKNANGTIELGEAIDITNSPGYDNQPSFTPDGRAILFTSVRGPSPALPDASPSQTDIYRYDIASRAVSRVTQTAESEYSPTVMPDGTRVSVVRVEADGTQRLWSVTPSGPKIQLDVLLPDVKPVGYHAWADDHTLALFVLGQPATLQLADTRTGAARTIASDIGRSIQVMPGPAAGDRMISFVQRERTSAGTRLVIKKLNPRTAEVSVLTPAVEGSTEADTAWTPDGTLLMAHAGVLFSWRPGDSTWKEAARLERLSLSGVTRLAVSPKGDYLALVGSPRQSR